MRLGGFVKLGCFLPLVLAFEASAVSITEYPNFDYDLRFTNPVCATYEYDQPILSVSGELLKQKPKNAYCKYSDGHASGSRPDSVQSKLLEWISDTSTREIFLAYLSFSNSRIRDELCKAVQTRGVRVTVVLDSTTDLEKVNVLTQCRPAQGGPAPKLVLRGHEGGTGYAHNKLFMVNPRSDVVRIAFSSGNMSSGVTLHHENWNFITVDAVSHFAQAHRCLMRGVLEHGGSRKEYSRFISACRHAIEAQEEDDLKVFFVPGEGNLATEAMIRGARDASRIYVAAHRFSYNRMMQMLENRLRYGGVEVRLLLDDDLYWAGVKGEKVGPNERWEYAHVRRLTRAGASVRYLETNHADHLLHHNKFLVFVSEDHRKSSVFAGAGNLTGTAFTKNFENFYWIRVPGIVDRFIKQYRYLWHDLATAPHRMPESNVLP